MYKELTPPVKLTFIFPSEYELQLTSEIVEEIVNLEEGSSETNKVKVPNSVEEVYLLQYNKFLFHIGALISDCTVQKIIIF